MLGPTPQEPTSLLGRRAAEAHRFRGDIDGLRAVAILLVVAFHAEVPGFDGGFVGVDVFFVISGYLISSALLADAEGEGVSLVGFWARRVRRLVPALALLVVVVLGVALLVYNPLEWSVIADEARAASLYVSNLYYAGQASDYFAGDLDQSLFLHTWSLGVEEQFYLVWPLLVVGVSLAFRRRRAVLRRALVAVFAVTLVASFAWCLVLTDAGSPWAFFGLPTRAWEFAAAALLAAVPVARVAFPRVARTVLVAAGLASIAAATLLFSGATPYPGAYALVPVVGTLLVIVAGIGSESLERETTNPLSEALSTRPAQWIGRVSYSWYLWHWPLVLLAVAWLDRDTLTIRVGAVGVALVIAALAHRFVENPVRYGSTFTSSAPRTFALGGGLTVVALLASVGVVTYADREVAGEDLLAELEEVRATRTQVECTVARETEGGDAYCLEGDPDGDVTILLVGDSHARHWQKTFAEVAASEGIRLLVRYRGACPSTNVPVVAPGSLKVDEACTNFQAGTDALIDELEPDAVVLSNTAAYLVAPDEPRYSPEGKGRFWAEGFQERVDWLRERGIPVGVVADNPRLAYDPIDCVIENGTADACSFARADAFPDDMGAIWAAERAAVAELGLPELDINPQLCPDDVCLVQLDGEWVYTDDSHLYAGYTATQRPAVEAFLQSMVDSIDAP